MINVSSAYFFMIEPDKVASPSPVPLEDELTAKVDFIFSKAKPSKTGYRGFHQTRCGKRSDNRDWMLPGGIITNSLATYYIRHYREAIPQDEIDKVHTLYNLLLGQGSQP